MKAKNKGKPTPKVEEPHHFTFYQDFALALCIEKYGACPFGCAKDGGPNCNWYVFDCGCEPARLTHAEAETRTARYLKDLREAEEAANA